MKLGGLFRHYMLLIILLFLFLVFLLVLLSIVGTLFWCKKNKAVVSRNPIFGTLSVAAPFLGGVLVYLLICQANSFFVGLFMVPLSLIGGATLAIVAWLRRERYRSLAWIGLPLNSALLILVILVVLEGSPKADNEFMRQVNDTKAHTSAAQVKAVALPSLLKPGKDTDIPKEILTLPFFKTEGEPEVRVLRDVDDKVLLFKQGGGFASQGIIVCFGDASPTNIVLIGTIIRWDDGVYFWADWRVRRGVDKKDVIMRHE
jgi:hypothetical protein